MLASSSRCKRCPGHQVLYSTWCDCCKNLQYFLLPWLWREALFHTHCFSRWECNTEKNKLFVHWLCPHGEHVFSLKVLRSNPLCSISLGCQVLAGTPPVLCPMSCLVLISKCPPYPHAAWLLFPGLAHCFIESIVARFLMHFAARVQEHSAI